MSTSHHTDIISWVLAKITIVTAAALFALSLAGCGMATPDVKASFITHLDMHGKAKGGQQPVSGARIQLFSAGSTGYASASTPLLTSVLLSDEDGGFSISGFYECPSAESQVYLSATGGNPGLSGTVSNDAIALVVALGDCSNLRATQNIVVNEVTTVAASWALAPFASDVLHLGTSPSNAGGFQRAMQNAQMLADTASGSSPGLLPFGVEVESRKVYTLANLLAACVNSDGQAACSRLFSTSTILGRTAPQDTFQSAVNIATHPGVNVDELFNQIPSETAFGTSLHTAPNDWTICLSYTGGGLSGPTAIAIDQQGTAWVANIAGSLSAFESSGSLWPSGLQVESLDEPTSLAFDTSSNLWVSNGSSAIANSGNGSLTKLGPDRVNLSGRDGWYSDSINVPTALVADSDGVMWVANSGAGSIARLSPGGELLSGQNGYGTGFLSHPHSIALDDQHNAWVVSRDSGVLTKLSRSGDVLAQLSCCISPDYAALDSRGILWVTDYALNQLVRVDPKQSSITVVSVPDLSGPSQLAVDGANQVWVANFNGNSLSTFSGRSAAETDLSSSLSNHSLGKDIQFQQPTSVAVDASGVVWVTSFNDDRVVAMLGPGFPKRTPSLGLPHQP